MGINNRIATLKKNKIKTAAAGLWNRVERRGPASTVRLQQLQQCVYMWRKQATAIDILLYTNYIFYSLFFFFTRLWTTSCHWWHIVRQFKKKTKNKGSRRIVREGRASPSKNSFMCCMRAKHGWYRSTPTTNNGDPCIINSSLWAAVAFRRGRRRLWGAHGRFGFVLIWRTWTVAHWIGCPAAAATVLPGQS